MSEASHLVSYFQKSLPADIDKSILPTGAQDVVVATVRIVGRPTYMVGREQLMPERPAGNWLYRVKLEILSVDSGSARPGESLNVSFGLPNGSGLRSYHPLTPEQLSQRYAVVMYMDQAKTRSLAGFCISQTEYEAWAEEVRAYERDHSQIVKQYHRRD
jgi:hypothetical protein